MVPGVLLRCPASAGVDGATALLAVRLRYSVSSSVAKHLPRSPIAAHTAIALDSATGGGRLTPQTLTCGSRPTGTKINPIVNVSFTMGFIGAGGRTRTGTMSPSVDFESTTSTNSITPAGVEKLHYSRAFACCGARQLPCCRRSCVFCRPLPLAQFAPPASGSAHFAPHHTGRCFCIIHHYFENSKRKF